MISLVFLVVSVIRGSRRYTPIVKPAELPLHLATIRNPAANGFQERVMQMNRNKWSIMTIYEVSFTDNTSQYLVDAICRPAFLSSDNQWRHTRLTRVHLTTCDISVSDLQICTRTFRPVTSWHACGWRSWLVGVGVGGAAKTRVDPQRTSAPAVAGTCAACWAPSHKNIVSAVAWESAAAACTSRCWSNRLQSHLEQQFILCIKLIC